MSLFALFLIALFAYLLYRYQKQYKAPTVAYSTLSQFPKGREGRVKWLFLLILLPALASALLAIAFLDPHTFVPRNEKLDHPYLRDPKEGRILFVVLDQSGSMSEPMVSSRSQSTQSKLAISKEAIAHFIELRPNDLIGLSKFARKTDIVAPPTLDHQAVLNELKKVEIIKGENEDGTAIGYAIYKTATLIENLKEASLKLGDQAPYAIKGAGIVLVTDGLQDPNPLDKDNPTRSMELSQAAQYARDHDIRLYVLNVEPRLNQAQYLPNLNEMKRIAEMTHGAFYLIEKPSQVSEIMDTINELEASTIREPINPSDLPTLYERVSYTYPFFLGGFILLALFLLLRATYLRVSP